MKQSEAGEQPRRFSLPLGGNRQDAGRARAFINETFPTQGFSQLSYDACLLVSELVANVALHAGTACELVLDFGPELVRVEVRDSSPAMPRSLNFSRDATTGRGLQLLAAVSTRWGADRADGGKSVWFELDRSAGAEPVTGAGP